MNQFQVLSHWFENVFGSILVQISVVRVIIWVKLIRSHHFVGLANLGQVHVWVLQVGSFMYIIK